MSGAKSSDVRHELQTLSLAELLEVYCEIIRRELREKEKLDGRRRIAPAA